MRTHYKETLGEEEEPKNLEKMQTILIWTRRPGSVYRSTPLSRG